MKTSPKLSYSPVIENERFGLVFTKTGSIISGNGLERNEWIHVSNEKGQGKTNAERGTWLERKDMDAVGVPCDRARNGWMLWEFRCPM